MVRVDGNKIQEIRDRFVELAEREIKQANDDTETPELKEDDLTAIHNKWKFASQAEINKLMSMSPEKLFKSGMAVASQGWRQGYTKPTLKSRTDKRRTKNKAARKARKQQRNLQCRK
jgi:hypothetical protein